MKLRALFFFSSNYESDINRTEKEGKYQNEVPINRTEKERKTLMEKETLY